MSQLKGRHFVNFLDLSPTEVAHLLDVADRIKADRHAFGSAPLEGQTMAMIFQKPSLRTRVSFEAGMTQLGGHAIYLAPSDISLGKRETTEDIALVLSRMADFIMARVFGHHLVEDLAKHATVPVINALSDTEHPCQALADLQTIRERKGHLEGLTMCFIGDGNNVANSLMFAAATTGMNIRVITPEGFEPLPEIVARAQAVANDHGCRVTVTNDLGATAGADVLYTDVWASMGQEAEAHARRQIFAEYRIDTTTMERARDDAIILHCLPAHYGDEIDYETSRLPNSSLFDQAENRLHAQKALILLQAGVA